MAWPQPGPPCLRPPRAGPGLASLLRGPGRRSPDRRLCPRNRRGGLRARMRSRKARRLPFRDPALHRDLRGEPTSAQSWSSLAASRLAWTGRARGRARRWCLPVAGRRRLGRPLRVRHRSVRRVGPSRTLPEAAALGICRNLV